MNYVLMVALTPCPKSAILGSGEFAQFLIKFFGDQICKLLILEKTVSAKFLNRELLARNAQG